MIRFRAFRAVGALSLLALGLVAAQGCTSSPGRTIGGTAGSSSAGSSGSAGAISGSAGSGTAGVGEGTAGASGGNQGSAGATPGTAGASGGSMGSAGAVGSAGATVTDASTDGTSPPFDASGRTPPTCTTPKPNPNHDQSRAGECDYLLQSLDFDDMYSYPSPAGSITVTNYGEALGAFEINNCGPYCYSKALTVGVDIVGGGTAAQTQGEIIVHFPTTGAALPIATAIGRSSLGWIQLDGPTMPPFKITGQMVLETSGGIVTGKEVKQLAYDNWLAYTQAEFKYFPVQSDTFSGPPVNVTGIGFRISGPANLAKGMEWHGVAYIDHLQIRAGTPDNPQGMYPFGMQ
ncbi:MAG TPA: hypothetical protein VLA14_09780 [Polyangia bacterium]|jgi:hypothetical protein|nr:hypothetical protein [Polyangia bacterium]